MKPPSMIIVLGWGNVWQWICLGNLIKEIKTQAQKAARGGGCLNDLVWGNKYVRKETKSKIFKETVRPIMTNALETRAET